MGAEITQRQAIAMNRPLKENIFLIVVAIENNIPVILTGPPGSSKTLSVKLVYSSMTGERRAASRLFSRKPRLIMINYQCSELATSEGINKVFTKAIKIQSKYD